MTITEQRYAQIEKEALTFTWACERLQGYLVGLKFHIQTDHKPLVPLFSTKHLEQLPIRIQRFRLRMMRFDYTISHLPGKELYTADMLSRAPVDKPSSHDESLEVQVCAYVDFVVETFPASNQRIKEQQKVDQPCDSFACPEGHQNENYFLTSNSTCQFQMNWPFRMTCCYEESVSSFPQAYKLRC